MKKLAKMLSVVLATSMIISLCSCSDNGGSKKRSRRDRSEKETEEEKETETEEEETEAEPTEEPEETSLETTVETTEESKETEPSYADVEWYLQDESVFDSFIPEIVVPGHEYKELRVGDHPEFYQMYKGYFDETMISPQFNMEYYTMDDNYIGASNFVLEGIRYPGAYGKYDDAISYSIGYYLCRKFECGLWVYLETDGVPDENGNLHGYIWFDPNATMSTGGTCLPSTELTQLNEELLMLGFAEPDPDYTGTYAEVYAQYPSFNSDFSGYPIVRRLFKNSEQFDLAVAFYDPMSEQLNNKEYFSNMPYDVAFPED